jgi:succinylglutamate desuccinylase
VETISTGVHKVNVFFNFFFKKELTLEFLEIEQIFYPSRRLVIQKGIHGKELTLEFLEIEQIFYPSRRLVIQKGIHGNSFNAGQGYSFERYGPWASCFNL